MIKTPLTVVALVCSFALASFADETSAKSRLDQIFKNFDTNGDGGISLEEYAAGMVGNMSPQRVPKVFKEKDRNGDGKLSKEELLIVPQDQMPAKATPSPEKKTVKNDKKAPAR